jgi:hypothetical protein
MLGTSSRVPLPMPKHSSATRSPASRLQSAVAATSGIARAYRPGLQALEPCDAARVSVPRGARLTGSVNVDRALKPALPNAARWDYAIGRGRPAASEEVLWVEVHPASGGRHFREMDEKVTWLLGWLRSDAPAMNYTPRRLIWVASGRSSFGGNDPKLRALRNRGLEFVGRHLRL